jgi:hypothetical protein
MLVFFHDFPPKKWVYENNKIPNDLRASSSVKQEGIEPQGERI